MKRPNELRNDSQLYPAQGMGKAATATLAHESAAGTASFWLVGSNRA